MRAKPGSYFDVSGQEKQERIGQFIRRHLGAGDDGGMRSILLVTRSGDSPVARALAAAASELAFRGIEARIIVASDECGSDIASGTARGTCDLLAREVRIARNPRLLDAHEQLVLGERAIWFGDCMRRDPLKRDAFESFTNDDAAAARRARMTFEKLWRATDPLYVHKPEPAYLPAMAAPCDTALPMQCSQVPEAGSVA